MQSEPYHATSQLVLVHKALLTGSAPTADKMTTSTNIKLQHLATDSYKIVQVRPKRIDINKDGVRNTVSSLGYSYPQSSAKGWQSYDGYTGEASSCARKTHGQVTENKTCDKGMFSNPSYHTST